LPALLPRVDGKSPEECLVNAAHDQACCTGRTMLMDVPLTRWKVLELWVALQASQR
jgi:hypothetical protein